MTRAWAVRCERCAALLATQDEAAFLQNNPRSVHLGLRHELFAEELSSDAPDAERTLRCTTRSDVSFAKTRQPSVKKRATAPFVLLCPRCCTKVASQVVLNDWVRAEHLFDSKACTVCVSDDDGASVGERVAFKKFAQLMGTLMEMRLQVNIQRPGAADEASDESGGADAKQSRKAVKTRPPAMVWPTVDSIREYFTDHEAHCKLSTLRDYQVELVMGAAMENTIIYLPTGCGKTLVAVKTITFIKALNPGRKAAFLVPTVPLVSQQASYLRRESDLSVLEVSGQNNSSSQKRKLGDADVIVATPQFFDNLLFNRELALEQFCVLVFDEAHHAIRKHPYCDILQRVALMAEETRPRIVALTASPFGQKATTPSMEANKTIRSLCTVFNASLNTPTIAADALELKNVFKTVEWVPEELSTATQQLQSSIRRHINEVSMLLGSLDIDGGTLNADAFSMSISDDEGDQREDIYVICGNLRKIQDRVGRGPDEGGSKRDLVLLLRHLRKILMVLPQLALQGPKQLATTLHDYFARLEQTDIRLYALIQASYTRDLRLVLQTLMPSPAMVLRPEDEVSDKVKIVAKIVEACNFTTQSRAIVFVRRRKTAIQLAEIMEKIPSLRALNPTRFIGHNSFEGMSWEEEQKPTLDRFRRGLIRLLVATSVLEEGLDVPECSLVIQFDGIIGMTSLVQSRGRARRLEGRFVVICAPRMQYKLQNIVDGELMMLELARIAANHLESKNVTRKLMSEKHLFQETKGNAPSNQSRVQETLAEWSIRDWKFCILLGSMRSGGNLSANDRDAALRAIHECKVVGIAAVDQVLNLVALDAVGEGEGTSDFLACYERLCERVRFAIEREAASRRAVKSHFWMRILSFSDGVSSTEISKLHTRQANDHLSQFHLRCSAISRGQFTTEESFRALDSQDFQQFETRLLKVDNLLVIEVSEDVRFEFDLCAVHNHIFYKEAVSADQWILYATFRHAPKIWQAKTSTRLCVDFHMMALSFAFRLHAPTSRAVWQLCEALVGFGIEVRDTRMERIESAEEVPPPSFEPKSAMLAYAVETLASSCCFAIGPQLPQTLLEMVQKLNCDEIAVQALLRFEPTATTCGGIVTEFRDFLAEHFPSLKGLAQQQQRVVLKAIVTPTRVLIERPEGAPDNRVFRHFAPEHFLYVYFRDENRELLDFSDPLTQRLRSVMVRGIQIGSSHFQFLGCSLSQMRNSCCIFTDLDPEEIRAWMGELHTIFSPAKYLKRFGQAFSSTREAIPVHPQVLQEPAEDIEDSTGQYTFTDGCGEITLSAAMEVASVLALPRVPSAFQIRLSGAKGVLVVSNFNASAEEAADQSGTRGVRLRKSMVKFSSPHRTLEIVGVASAHSVAYLTRQSITILSDLGIPDATFLSLQDEYVASLAMLLVSDSLGLMELRAALPPDQVRWIDILYGRRVGDQCELNLVHQLIIHAIYQYKLVNTVFRARIPVSKGRNLMGVADFTGTLKYGEVFVQYSERDPSGDANVVRNVVLSDVDVLVHRSPCHHPGDVRLLRCRSDVPPALKLLRDCIVFPTSGPRPHPDECTGGDLDGDVFTVIWDERLLPARESIAPAMTLSDDPDATQNAEDDRTPVDSQRLIEFYLLAIAHNILGVASNAHAAVCDDSKLGSASEHALKLAEICAREVDYCKNPRHIELVQQLSPTQYPDFMRNPNKPAYKSQKVLGRMYRRALALVTCTAPRKPTEVAGRLDESLLAGGYETHVDRAKIMYVQYKHTIRMLLQMSGATSDAELATGMVIEMRSEYRAEYFRFGERSRDAFYKTQLSFKRQFLEVYGNEPASNRRQVAAAWYAVAYMDAGNDRCLSFPWILADLLLQNKGLSCDDKDGAQELATTPTRDSISDQVMELTTCQLELAVLNEVQEQFATLLAGFHDRLQAITALKLALAPQFGTPDVECVLFGSSSLLTFEAQSDLDVVLRPIRDVADLKTLAQFVFTAEGVGDVKLIENTHVPVLSLSVEGNWTVEISTSRNGPIKTAWFRAYMAAYPFFWPTAFFLMKWGKAAGLIRRRCVAGNGNGRSMFTPVGFLWLLLSFCLEKKFVDPIECPSEGANLTETEAEMAFWTSILQRSQSVSGHATTARVIMSFFSYFSDLATPTRAFGFDDPLDPINNTRLTAEDTEVFREECYVALHQLIISNGELLSLMDNQKDHRRRITLSRALSKHVHSAPEFHAAKIVRESGAQPANVKLTFTRHSNALRPDLYVADIEGDGAAVRLIEEKIERIEEALGTPQPRRSARSFHRSGCCLLLFEGALSQNEKIAFQAYEGPRQSVHQLLPLHQAHLTSFMNGQAWVEHAVDSFATKFIQQMVKLSHFEKLNPGQATAKAIARFGHHYLIHLPWSFHEESITLATIDKLEQEFERGRESRELYESVMVARQRDRESAREEPEEEDFSTTQVASQNGSKGDGRDDNSGGREGGREDKDHDNTTPSKAPQARRQMNGLSMEKASALMLRDRGVTNSFYPLIDPSVAPFLHEFALKRKHMHIAGRDEAYLVSIVQGAYEFNVRLTPTLQVVKVKTRACRWLSATLKMHQELLDDGSRMDSTPDVRFYVSATEDAPSSDPLPQLLERACRKAKDGHGVLQFVHDASDHAAAQAGPKRVRVSDELVAEGVTLSAVVNVRHIHSTTYQSASDGVKLRVMEVVEYALPTAEGFLSTAEKTEAEIVMPPLTPEARVSVSFARRFLLAGVELVAFLREKQRFGMADDEP